MDYISNKILTMKDFFGCWDRPFYRVGSYLTMEMPGEVWKEVKIRVLTISTRQTAIEFKILNIIKELGLITLYYAFFFYYTYNMDKLTTTWWI